MATSAKNWKKPDNEELTLPSGNTCLIRRPGMEALLASGIMPDSLTPIIMDAISEAQKGQKPQDHKKKKSESGENELSPEQMEKFLTQPGALDDIFASFDRVCEMVVVEPTVRYHKVLEVNEDGTPKKDVNGRDIWKTIPHGERDEDILYTDDVDSEDKEFLFQYVVGGDKDLESFRSKRDEGVGDLQSRQDVALPSQSTSGS